MLSDIVQKLIALYVIRDAEFFHDRQDIAKDRVMREHKRWLNRARVQKLVHLFGGLSELVSVYSRGNSNHRHVGVLLHRAVDQGLDWDDSTLKPQVLEVPQPDTLAILHGRDEARVGLPSPRHDQPPYHPTKLTGPMAERRSHVLPRECSLENLQNSKSLGRIATVGSVTVFLRDVLS